MISGLEHFAFCRRRWALIHVEQLWHENVLTLEGAYMHERVHDAGFTELRGSTLLSRAMPVRSEIMRVTGECDMVELHSDPAGVPIRGRDGLWRLYPVEYKRGRPNDRGAEQLQLCAQAMCLEEMLDCTITQGALYYGEIKHRVNIQITEGIKQNVKDMFDEMHQYYERGYTPKAKKKKACYVCSLKDLCLPELEKTGNVETYMNNILAEELEDNT